MAATVAADHERQMRAGADVCSRGAPAARARTSHTRRVALDESAGLCASERQGWCSMPCHAATNGPDDHDHRADGDDRGSHRQNGDDG